jgi:hypothetical protein
VPFIIAELDDGYTILELLEGTNPEDVAVRNGGMLADETVYDDYEEAFEALAGFEEDSYEPDQF